MQEYEVLFYDKADGTEPAKDFILSLDTKMRAKMLRTVSMLAANGPELREPASKPLGDASLSCGQRSVPISPVFCISSWWAAG